jgi:signal transduction histidine kinase
MSMIDLIKSNPEQALDRLRSRLENLDSTKDSERLELLADLTYCHYSLHQYAETIQYGLGTLVVSDELQAYDIAAKTCYWLYEAHVQLGDRAAALDFGFKQLDYSRRTGDREQEARALKAIGVCYSYMDRYHDALRYYDMAQAINEELHNFRDLGSVFNNKSIEYRHLGQLGEAEQSAKQAISLFESVGAVRGLIFALNNLAYVYIQQERYDDAHVVLSRSLELARANPHPRNLLSALRSLGRYYNAVEEPKLAVKMLSEALAVARSGEYVQLEFEIHNAMVESYKLQGQFEKALEHHERFHHLYVQINSEEQSTRLRNLEVLNETREAWYEAERLKDLSDYFKRLNDLKDEVMSTLSHDLKNPLSTISIQVSLLRGHGVTTDEKGELYLQRINRSVEKMRELIVRLLDLARLETGQSLELQPHSLREILTAAVEENQSLARAKGISATLIEPVPDAELTVDGVRIHEVFDNLLSNGIKFTRVGGHVIVTATVTDTDYKVTFQDTGMGIPKADLPHIFDRFHRVNDTDHLNVEGSGLGLAICKSIIEQHHGTITVDSEVGIGSAFTVKLPLEK